ncbi:hypothetical protein ABOONEI_2472 [Aciduliprofundum boonei T469]|nr:hypothetical protein ABOONEI_2472 [Aciduliprofundum boonei T469]
MEEETKKSSLAAQDQNEEILDEKIAKVLEQKLPELLIKAEEDIKKKKKQLEKERGEYVKTIQKYYPGAHTKELSFEEVKEIAEKLEEIAKKTNYTPIVPAKKPPKTFWGKNKKQSSGFILFLLALLGFVIVAKLFIGWW